jgi:hypothetical protein
MNNLIEKIKEQIPSDILTTEVLDSLLQGTSESRYGLVKRAIANGDLVHIKRGLYTLPRKHQRREINLYELSQWIYGPSYVSFESALAFHNWIPEAVYSVTCATSRNAKSFQTPHGLFVYKRIPYLVLYEGVERLGGPESAFFMATPLKALADYVYVNKKDWKGMEPLVEDLRIEEESLRQVNVRDLDALAEVFTHHRVRRFLKGLKKDINR